MCENRKFDRELKDKVVFIVSSLVKNHKSLQDLLYQKGRLSNDLEKVVRSTLKTFQGLTIGGIDMWDMTSQTSKINMWDRTSQTSMGKLPSKGRTSHSKRSPRIHQR